MSRDLQIRLVEVQGLTIYTCNTCGVRAFGGFAKVTVHYPELTLINTAVQNLSNSSMPFGWACFGRDTHKCPKCVRE